MQPRWITEEEWLRTGGAAKEPSHVPPERSPATVCVRPPSPQEDLPSPQEESSAAVEDRRKRLRIGAAALAFGGLGLILAAMFYAFEVIDQRALRAFKAAPHIIQSESATETAGDAANPAVSDPTQQTATGQTTTVPDPMLNTQQKVHRNAHHGRKTHGRPPLAFFLLH